jgi:hypothetical protein
VSEFAVWIRKFPVGSESLELLPDLAKRRRSRVAFLRKSLLGESDVASSTLLMSVVEARCGDAARLTAVCEDTHSARLGELGGSTFNTGRGVDSTRYSGDVVLREWRRRCKFEISVQNFVVPTDFIDVDASNRTSFLECVRQTFEATSSVHTGARHAFDGSARKHPVRTNLAIEISSAVADGAGELERTDEASDFTEAEAE